MSIHKLLFPFNSAVRLIGGLNAAQSIIREPGPAGKSAYQSAIDLGLFEGTEADWVLSLQADKSFAWHQSIASYVWTVPHNLGKFPAVMVLDSVGNMIMSDVYFVDENVVRITHAIALSGYVYCN
ncbi:hypothetical protein JCM14076_06640 [Methylosoma difficile]